MNVVADVLDPDRPETWKFQVALSLWSGENPPQSNEDRTRLFKKLAEPHCEPYRSAALRVPDDLNIPLDRVSPLRITPHATILNANECVNTVCCMD